MENHFEMGIDALRQRLLLMGSHAEMSVNRAIQALMDRNYDLALQVRTDDNAIDQFEIEIDEMAINLLTRAPLASNLRLVTVAMKISQNFERIGDEGEKIGLIASRLATMERPENKYREIKHLGRIVADMVHDALDAFARMDAEGALRVARRDRLVDEEYEAIHRQCITFMMEDPRTIRRALDVMWVVRSLERIGDHAKNICEYVIYMVHGKDVRHTNLEDVERELQKSKP